MKFQNRLARACACLLLAAAGAQAHAQQSLPAAADPQAAVPATRYQPAIASQPEATPGSTPDANWVAANRTVAATNSMALTMKAMPSHAGHAAHRPQAADPYAGHEQHGMQHGGQSEHAGMHGMQGMQHMKPEQPDGAAMCKPVEPGGQGKMSCCAACGESCCKGGLKMEKQKEPR